VNYNPPTSASYLHLTGITGMNYCAQFVFEIGVH
jgi:hypothetical protein